jgi:hypothetical protein
MPAMIRHTRTPPNPSGLCQCGCGARTKRARCTNAATGSVQGEHQRYVRGHTMRGRTGKRGPDNPRWNGGKVISSDGYVMVTIKSDHPFYAMAHKTGNRAGNRVLEHRLVMAEYLNRPLARHEEVHPINGDRADNRLENLQLRIRPHGPGQAYVCLDCGSDRVAPTELAEA